MRKGIPRDAISSINGIGTSYELNYNYVGFELCVYAFNNNNILIYVSPST